MRQGLLSEPEASSGPAAMLLAVSRNPSSIPPTESLPGAMPPSSGVPQPHPPLKISKTSPTASTPEAMPPSSGVPRPHPPLKTSKNIPNCIHLSKPQKHPQLHPLPEQCHLPLASLDHIPPNETSNVSPPASNAKSRRQKNLSHRHETPAFSFPGLP